MLIDPELYTDVRIIVSTPEGIDRFPMLILGKGVWIDKESMSIRNMAMKQIDKIDEWLTSEWDIYVDVAIKMIKPIDFIGKQCVITRDGIRFGELIR